MKLHIESAGVWYPGCEQGLKTDDIITASSLPCATWPKLSFIPAMQRRRLSPFAKIALFSAHQATEHTLEQLAMVFSSRHGDLHKTSELLGELAQGNELSPTAFSLSVHNAVAGLYSIFNQNKSPINAVSAGQDSLFMALVDAYARLKSGLSDKILIVHADQTLPEVYEQFKDEIQVDHAIAIVVRLAHSDEACIELNFSQNQTNQAEPQLPLALLFAHWLNSSDAQLLVSSAKYAWSCQKHG